MSKFLRSVGLVGLSLSLLTACAPARFTVLEWSGNELPEFWQPFADQHPQVKVEFTFFTEDAEAYAKMQSGFVPDVNHACLSWWQLYVDAGLVQPLDVTRLKNWSGVDSQLAALGQFNGQTYFVPVDWGYESILVRTDKVAELPTAWADLWNPQYKGHIAFYDAGESAQIVAGLALGFDPWHVTPDQQAQIKQKMIELKPNLVSYWTSSTDADQLLASGDAWLVSNAWTESYMNLKNQGVPVTYITPAEGRLGFLCGYGIPAKAKNVDLAYDYLNALIDPQAMANFANAYAYGVSNLEALPLIEPEIVAAMQLDQPDILNQTVFYQPLTDAQREAFTAMWAEVKAAP